MIKNQELRSFILMHLHTGMLFMYCIICFDDDDDDGVRFWFCFFCFFEGCMGVYE